ncbi:MAG: UDP-2,4-diacetamido-2,4,6-trideoxy-beta-L-altropyranose hydrolase [Campylobacterota bacterium]|nr:UDP-2,4-diacetamido-2,4,6-trideoxy-beta-L-altropyranose hydrolase [Campylobacterota bacterium]
MKNILFRADSSSIIGTGHIMRDLVLVNQYENANIIFAVQDLKGNINHKIIEAGYKIEILKSNDIKELNKLIQKHNIDLLVIDHYEIDENQEKKLKIKNQKLKILSFDDTYEKHHCDILLNHNISANKKKYKNLVPKNCELRCGKKYTLLRDEFIKEKKKKTIFLAMGGADHSNINIKILKVLKKFNNIKVNLVTTNANKNLEELQQYIKNKSWIKLHINSTKIAKLMKKSDFAIITPSVTLNEIYFMNIPFIAIQTASNQKDMYDFIKKEKLIALKKFNKNKLIISIKKLKNENR